jgi:hypothetical protein
MTRIRTWARTAEEAIASADDIRLLRGSVVTGLRYYVPRALSTQVRRFDGFDIVPGAVLLVAQPHPIFIVWSMDDLYGEGIAVVRGAEHADWITDLDLIEAPVDLSSSHSPRMFHRPVSRIAVSWQEAPSGVSEAGEWRTVWALTLGASDASITFALGAADDTMATLEYQPDSVAVISDADLARRYRPVASTSAAAGQLIWEALADEPQG